MFEKQSIGGAAKQENQQVDRTSGEIALDVESLPCANGCSEAPSQTLPLGICYVDQESGAHTTQQTGIEQKVRIASGYKPALA